MRCSSKLCRLRVILVCLWSIARTTNGGSITWYEPLPVETIVDVNVYHTNSTQFLEGKINATLTWNFSLTPDLSFTALPLKLNDVLIARAVSSGQHGVLDGFKERFDISWIPDQRVTLVIFNVTTNENGTYTCEVSTNEGFVAKVWKSEIQVNVLVPSHIDHISGNQTVNETDSVTLFCRASGNPTPTITWTRLSDNSNVTFPLKISRQDQGGYRCTADNGVGSPATKETFITVQYNPDNVTLVTNTTENKDCSYLMVVNFTCVASEANPEVTNYQLYGSGGVLSVNNSGMWIKEISREGKHVYGCLAEHPAGDKPSANVTLTKNVPVQISVNLIKGTTTLEEGGDLSLYCNATGFPDPTITWTKDGVDESSSWLNFTNITRDEAGNYTCHANNTCGDASVMTSIYVQFSPGITHISANKTVLENENVTLNCTADGHPRPVITWTTLSNDRVVTFPLTISRQDEGYYRCTANNSIGSPATKDVFITVLYPPNIIHISGNQNKNDGDEVTLNCTADGKPTPNITWTVGNIKKHFGSNFPLTISGKQDEGSYTCTADNGIRSQDSDSVFITVENYRPINTNLTTSDLTVVLNESFTLTCSSQANPPAKYRFYREQQNFLNTAVGNNTAMYTTSVNDRSVKQVTYNCTPFNDYGDGPTRTVTVSVYYKPENVTLTPPSCAFNGSVATFTCTARANPPVHTYRLYENDSMIMNVNGSGVWKRTLNTSGQFNYRCDANNSVATVTSNITLTVQVVVEILKIKLNVSNKRCTNFSKENFTETIILILGPEGLVCPEIKNCTNGSAIIDLVLRFNQSVNETYVIAVLKKAAKEGKFGDFVVDPESIKLTSQSSTASPSPSPTGTGTGGTKVPVCEETFLKDADCSTIVWKIVVLAVAGVVLIVIVAGIIAWWVHKRRKCRKDPRIHNSEERLHGNPEDNAYSQVNHGYAGTGPRPNGTEAVALQQRAVADGSDAAAPQQEAAAIPTYAEVDKSKKKKKAEEKLDYTYAEVDKSKKSKKKPKSGEMIYADLEDINVPRPMPTVSTSPQPLPPIKRPEPYENTQYADITQFLKGDATLPQSDSNQGTELQPQGANKDEDSTGGEDRNTPISRQDVQFGIEGNTDAQVNNKYAVSGPTPASATDGAVRQQKPDANRHEEAPNQQAAAAPPTYTAVDKSKKKSKRKKEEEKSPGNSVVDKSQTKKQSDDTYAQVDKSKKSIRKQPNPEGVIYADLEGINMPRMPQVSTSPQPLPPLKRPTPYEGTEYADITEFRKRDASPKTDDCINPEMQAQGTNKDGIGENNNETSF